MEKINIAELLKDCPSGMELDCTMFENVTFEDIKQGEYPIIVKIKEPSMLLSLTKTGCWNLYNSAKCVIFPKGKTTWEGFHRPFMDGEVVAYDNPSRKHSEIFIFKDKKENNTLSTCYLMLDGDELVIEEGAYYVTRLATEEEKKKLFNVIKENGYKWNHKTKTLEKLPKFKVDNKIKLKGGDEIGYVTQVTDCYFTIKCKNNTHCWPIERQDAWELVPNKFDITTLKPYDKVLYRMHDKDTWCNSFYSFYKSNHHFVTSLTIVKQCIPYDGNEHLLGTTDDCDEYFKTWG